MAKGAGRAEVPVPAEGGAGRRWVILGIIALAMFSFLTLDRHFFAGKLYHDNEAGYGLFHDNLHSLNQFGEPAWWLPNIQAGFPGYYYSLLMGNSGSPVFMAFGFACWLLGLAGVMLTHFLPLYVIYFGFAVPLLFLFAVWGMARRLLQNPWARVYVLLIAAFSPAVIAHLSDANHLEPLAYALFFVGAYMDWLRQLDRRRFFWLLFTISLLGLSCNYNIFVAVLPFCLLAAVFSVIPATSRGLLRQAWAATPLWKFAVCVLVFGVAASANLTTLRQGGTLGVEGTRAVEFKEANDPDSRVAYPLWAVKPGNPLEYLGASTPGVSFGTWDNYMAKRDAFPPQFLPESHRAGSYGYGYLGLLCIPLAAIGLITGRSPLREGLIAALGLFMLILALAAFSPFFSPAFELVPLLRSVNHFSDLTYRASGNLLLILAAGLGIQSLLEGARARRWALLMVFGGWTVLSAAFIMYLRDKPPVDTLMGLAAASACLFAVLLACMAREEDERYTRLWVAALVCLAAVDVSSVAYWHVRTTMNPPAMDYDRLAPGGVGLAAKETRRNLDTILRMRQLDTFRRTGMPFEALPYARLFQHAETVESGKVEKRHVAEAISNRRDAVLALNESAEARAVCARLAEASAQASGLPAGDIRLTFRSYNEVQMQVESPEPAVLFLSDAYAPYWVATLNGQPAPVLRALDGFKAVLVPAGSSLVTFRFVVPMVGTCLIAAYGLMLIIFLAALREN